MKILFASNLYGALARGGAERVVAEETASLRSLGHDVVVVSGDPSAGLRAESTATDGTRHIRYAPPNLAFYADLAKHGPTFRLWWHYFDIFNVASASRFAAIVRAEKPDVVHTHNLMGLGFMIPSALRRLRVRHVHTVHDVQLLDPSGLLPADREFRPALHQSLYIAVMRAVMGSPDVVVFPSEFHKRLHERFGFFPKSRREVLRNPAPASVAPAREGRRIPGENLFLFVGQLEGHKGEVDLLDAWERGRPKGGKLEIAGGGSNTPVVSTRISAMDGARLLGKLDAVALDEAYGRADWIVAPSRVIENAPMALMEALGRGIPAIASMAGGIPELVREGEGGHLFPSGDAAGLAAALQNAVAVDDATYALMSAAARASLVGLDGVAHAQALISLYAPERR